MSLEGDLDELDEFFCAFASFNSKSAMRLFRSSICFACSNQQCLFSDNPSQFCNNVVFTRHTADNSNFRNLTRYQFFT